MVRTILQQYTHCGLMSVLTCQLKWRSLMNVDIRAVIKQNRDDVLEPYQGAMMLDMSKIRQPSLCSQLTSKVTAANLTLCCCHTQGTASAPHCVRSTFTQSPDSLCMPSLGRLTKRS